MRCLMFLSLLLAIKTEFSVSGEIKGPIVTTGYSGASFSFDAYNLGSNPAKCVVNHNGVLYEFYPKKEHPRIRHGQPNSCSFDLINVQAEDEGTWDIMYFGRAGYSDDATDIEPNIDRYEFKVFDEEDPQLQEDSTTKLRNDPTTESTSISEPTTPPRIPVVGYTAIIGSHTYFYDDSYEEVLKCIAVHNDKQYEIYPNMNLPNAYYGLRGGCTFKLDQINWEHAGEWKITGYYLQKKEDREESDGELVEYSMIYNLIVHEVIKAQPTSKLIMNTGYASFHLPKTFENPTSCRLTDTKGNSYELLGDVINPNEGIELYQDCGVRMRYDEKRVGSWTLIQSQGPSQEIQARFVIDRARDNESPTTHHLFWQRGTSVSFEVKYSTFYCDVVKPDGTVIPLTDKFCKYNLDVVSGKHAGIWKGRYGVSHDMRLVEEKYIVEVWNPEAVEISIFTEGSRINMLCKTEVESLNSCIFQSPNGTIFSLQAGMGDGNYEYYGNGFILDPSVIMSKKAECGLTIREPALHDYGHWTCSMRNNERIIGSLIHVANPKVKALGEANVSTSPVFVKRGDEFTIKCRTNAPLNYCWLQSPNGTMYSVTKTGSGENLLRYNGEGLSMGVCGAVVENADDTYNGDWSCRLGVVGAAEVESIVPVTVTESELIPRIENITIRQGKPIVLSCDIFPSSEATIDYCRWVRPNGHGIYRDIVSRYVSDKNNTTCTLIITDLTPDDIGTWMCFARLSTGSDEEVWSKLELQTGTGETTTTTSTALHIVGIVLLVTTLICGSFVIIALYRKKQHRTPPPPLTYDINYGFPKDAEIKVIPNFDTIKNFEKSFKQ